MSITDELREWKGNINTRLTPETVLALRSELNCIADRIDAEHERAMADAELAAAPTEAQLEELGYIALPLDADGVTIRIGDEVTCGATVWTVTGLKFLGYGWGICCTVCNEYGGSSTSVYPPSDMRHHRAPTVEDVLDEFANAVLGCDNTEDSVQRVIAEYAARLRLAGDAE